LSDITGPIVFEPPLLEEDPACPPDDDPDCPPDEDPDSPLLDSPEVPPHAAAPAARAQTPNNLKKRR
jgi:hypothetical protein